MAALTETQRQRIWSIFMSKGHSPPTLTKAQVRAAVDDLDDFIDTTGATAVNNAFPAAFKSAATAKQKALVLAYVALERAGVL